MQDDSTGPAAQDIQQHSSDVTHLGPLSTTVSEFNCVCACTCFFYPDGDLNLNANRLMGSLWGPKLRSPWINIFMIFFFENAKMQNVSCDG